MKTNKRTKEVKEVLKRLFINNDQANMKDYKLKPKKLKKDKTLWILPDISTSNHIKNIKVKYSSSEGTMGNFCGR